MGCLEDQPPILVLRSFGETLAFVYRVASLNISFSRTRQLNCIVFLAKFDSYVTFLAIGITSLKQVFFNRCFNFWTTARK